MAGRLLLTLAPPTSPPAPGGLEGLGRSFVAHALCHHVTPSAVFLSLQSFVPHVHSGKPTGSAASRCMICIRVSSSLLHFRSAATVICGIFVALGSPEP